MLYFFVSLKPTWTAPFSRGRQSPPSPPPGPVSGPAASLRSSLSPDGPVWQPTHGLVSTSPQPLRQDHRLPAPALHVRVLSAFVLFMHAILQGRPETPADRAITKLAARDIESHKGIHPTTLPYILHLE